MRTASILGRRMVSIVSIAFAANVAFAVPGHASTTASYGMDETSGTTMRGEGGPDGAISGDVDLNISGATAGGYQFNTNVGNCDSSGHVTGTGHVVIPANSIFSPGTQAFSFSIWVNTTAVPGTGNCDYDVFRRGNIYKLELLPYSTNKAFPMCRWKGSAAGVSLKPKVQVNDGDWHQITCQRTASGVTEILDGTKIASSSTNVGSLVSSGKVFVASKPANADYYVGQLDDFSFVVG